jgi:hypothetical protein
VVLEAGKASASFCKKKQKLLIDKKFFGSPAGSAFLQKRVA